MNRYTVLPIVIFGLIVLFAFRSFVLQGLLPIPADTVVGLYHPFRDAYAANYPNGIPYKNALITDPVRQQFPWRSFGISSIKDGEMPLWNPYEMGGIPHFSNIQSATFYPLNLFLFLSPFYVWWCILVLSQPFLAGIFLFFFLRNKKLSVISSLFGGFVFAFSGFFVAWLEWGTVLHVALWLPLLLLSVDKLFEKTISKTFPFFDKNVLIWSFIFLFCLTASFLAGHLQIFLYLLLVVTFYFFIQWFHFKREKSILLLFIILNALFLIFTAIQWMPTLQLISVSARNIDQANWNKEGWFIPWQNLIQFIAPDFFGNPTTLNYWGVWNYAEFVGYIGIVPLMFSIYVLIYRRDKITYFFAIILFVSLLFSLPTFIAKFPFLLNAPFLSTSQPTRLLFLVDFSLAILAAFGLEHYKKTKKSLIFPLLFLMLTLIILWGVVVFARDIFINPEFVTVAKRNLYLPTVILLMITVFILSKKLIRHIVFEKIFLMFLIFLTIFDLFRFFEKFTPFTKREYLFPSTKALEFLSIQQGQFRIMTTDSRILPPNFTLMYRLQSIDGYDPLYLQRYGELIAVSERGKPDISPPFGFNRIITPRRVDSSIVDLLGVRYVLSLSDISSKKLAKVFQEGQTRVYENRDAFPRAFFVDRIYTGYSKENAIKRMMGQGFDLRNMAVVEDTLYNKNTSFIAGGEVSIVKYSPNTVIVHTQNSNEGFLVLTDTFYPTWRAVLDKESQHAAKLSIFRTDYNFRGVYIPKGNHTVTFYNTLF